MSVKSNIYHFNAFRKLSHYSFCIFDIHNFLADYPQFRLKHALDFYALFLVNKGQGFIEVNRNRFKPAKNSVILIRPYEEYDISEAIVEGKVIFLCQDFYTEEFNITNLFKVFAGISVTKRNPMVNIPGKKYQEFEKIVSSIYTEYNNQQNVKNSSAIIRSYLNILFLRLIYLKNGLQDNNDSYPVKTLSEFSKLLETNFNQQHNVSFYADTLGITQVNLNTILKRNLNINAKNLIQNKLMAEARKMLVSTDLSASEIAYKLNFHDNSYFTKVFLKYHKITPGRFRSAHKKYHK